MWKNSDFQRGPSGISSNQQRGPYIIFQSTAQLEEWLERRPLKL